MSLRSLAYYEKGLRKPRTKEGWKKLADFYGVSVNYLKIDNRVGVSSADYDKKLKEIFGEFVSLKNVGIDIRRFWLVTSSKELLETVHENPPIYLKLPFYVSLITGNALRVPEEVKINSENKKGNI